MFLKWFLIVFMFLIASNCYAKDSLPQKRALLVGVAGYDRGSRDLYKDWWNLNTLNDVIAMKKVLIERFGFKNDDIIELKRKEDTSRKSIIKSFNKLIKRTKAGDIVFFFYSGHGQSIEDDGDDEIDGKEESLVPSDYISRRDDANNIRDDEIRNLVNKLMKRNPGNLTLVFDCCFSGDITKGGRYIVRGARRAPGTKQQKKITSPRSEIEKSPSGLFNKGEADQNGYIVISASRHDQLSMETDEEKMGLLTYAFTRAIMESGYSANKVSQSERSVFTYRDLFDRINSIIGQEKNAEQKPVFEGQSQIDKAVLGSRIVIPEKYIPIHVSEDNDLTLKAGKLHGITRGSTFSIYPSETKNFKKENPIAIAEVSFVELSKSKLVLLSEYQQKKTRDLEFCRAVEKEHVYGDMGLRICASLKEDQEKLISELKKLSMVSGIVESEDDWDLRIRHTVPNSRELIIEREDGYILTSFPGGVKNIRDIRTILEREARWRGIKKLNNRDRNSAIQIDLRIVPVLVKLNKSGKVNNLDAVIDDKELKREDGYITFTEQSNKPNSEGERVMIELRNNGNIDAYVTVLDMIPDKKGGKVQLLWPTDRDKKIRIKPNNQWIRIRGRHEYPAIWQLERTPNGAEIFKAIATAEPVDYDSIVDKGTTKGFNRNLSPLAELIRAANIGQKASRSSVPPSDWSTASIQFYVK